MNEKYKTTGTIERLDPALDAIIDTAAKAEIIAEGFEWSEGPLWIEKNNMLLFSDVPTNTIYKWTEANGKEVYLEPSGYTDSIPSICKEPGSNGLILDSDANLVLCQHGDRRMARMDATLDKPAAKFITLADKYNGKRFSSPNDAVYNNGELFFTDPPYGLGTQDDKDPKKEIPFNGVYKLKKDRTVFLLTDSISRPNGIAFFPGGKRLLVASSDPDKPNWYSFDVSDDSLINAKIFYSAAGHDKKLRGLPDGLKIDKNGNVFATGPGGLYIFNSDGKLLGKIKLENASSNCALSPDEKTLYITNDMYVLRLKMRNLNHMKIYKTRAGIVIEKNEQFFLLKDENWDSFINDDNIYQKTAALVSSLTAGGRELIADILPPVGSQELWACGVTYLRSKVGRQEESKLSGGADFYAKVYDAERPEVFFKSTPHRIVGHGAKVNIRKDSTWDVPEPELTLVVTSTGKIIGYTIGNDMSSRSIEGENPLYLPQAKTYDACAAVGPCIFLTEQPLPADTMIAMAINRNKEKVFEGNVAISQMKRTVEELVSFVYRECSFPVGCLIMTGTGIVPGNEFTLQQGDQVIITIDGIGELVNEVA